MEVIRVAKKEKRDVLIPHKFLSIFETLAKQGKEKQATELIIGIIRFDMTGEEPNISDDGVAFVWESVIKPQLEENIQKYKEVSKARSEAVGNRYKQDNTNATNEYNCSNSNQKNEKNTIATDYDVDVDVDVDIDNDSELKEKINKKEKPQKHKYGQYQNVLLSDDELEKLKTEFPSIGTACRETMKNGGRFTSHLKLPDFTGIILNMIFPLVKVRFIRLQTESANSATTAQTGS